MAKGKSLQLVTLKKMLRYIGRYRWLLLLSLCLAALTVVGSLYIPILVGKAIDCIVAPHNVDFKKITSLLMQIGIITAVTACLQWLMNTVNNRITFHVVRDVRNDAFCKLQRLPLKYIDSKPSGEILNRIISDADQFADGLLMGFTQLFTGAATILCTLIFMLTIHAGIAAVVVVLTPLSLFVARFIANKTFNLFSSQSAVRAEQTAFVDENVGNIKVVQAFSREEKTLAEFDEINGRLQKCSLKATFYSSLTNPCTRFINSVVYAAVGLTGALAAISGGITVGGLSSFLSYANQYTKPFNEISGVITELQNALACAARLFDLINETPETSDSNNTKELNNITGKIDIENVDFSYSPDRPLIRGLNLSVTQGQRVAIVGPTGCGKTTLINLLMRFYDVNVGEIRVDDTDIRAVTRESLRRGFGMVLQDTWLRSGTVRENIALGRPQSSDEEIIAAAKAVHAHGFIKRLPQGYDTVIGENGSLSQGQRQLLCIARIMLCLPPMLILDEATSSIDTRTEMRIQRAFEKLMKGRTSFIVAHRLSTVREADTILVMRDGNIVEQGTHKQLLEKNGFYTELYNSQFAK